MKLARQLGPNCIVSVSFIALASACATDSFRAVGDLAGNEYSSVARDATLNGKTVVGDGKADEPNVPDNYEGEAFVWESGSGMHPLGYLPAIPGSTLDLSSVAYAISSDGWVAVGDSRYESTVVPGVGEHQAVRWLSQKARHLPITIAIGELLPGGRRGVASPPLALGFLPGGNRSAAFGVSKEGGVIVGHSRMDVGGLHFIRAFQWTDPSAGGSGMVMLDPGDAGSGDSYAQNVSDDGFTIVGFVPQSANAAVYRACTWRGGPSGYHLFFLPDPPDTAAGTFASGVSGDGLVVAGAQGNMNGQLQACRWERTFGTTLAEAKAAINTWKSELLGVLPGDSWSEVFVPGRSVSFDGAIVVGISGHDAVETAFAWDAKHGMRKVADVLTLAGLTVHQTWNLVEAYGVSGDASTGYTIVGAGVNPSNQWEGFVAHLDAKWF